MRLDEFVASRVEAVVHGLDLTDALEREPMATGEGPAVTAAIMDELPARRTAAGRPPDLGDDLAWVRAASGRGPAHPRPEAAPDRLRRRHGLHRGHSHGAVVASFAGTPDPRLRELLGSLVRHLHGFVREVEPTFEEWERAIGSLTETGQRCDDTRQEFILLSDVLGVTMLVDAINHRKVSEATESTQRCSTWWNRPLRELGDSIDLVANGQLRVVTGRVVLDGGPLAGAPGRRLAGRRPRLLRRPAAGRPACGQRPGPVHLRRRGPLLVPHGHPSAYPIPTDGPWAGLVASDRHPYRPAHIHFIAAAAGHLPVTTHVFVAGGPIL